MTHAGKLGKSFTSGRAWPTRHIIYAPIFVLSLLLFILAGRGWVVMRTGLESDSEALFHTVCVDTCGGCVCVCARVKLAVPQSSHLPTRVSCSYVWG